MNIPDGLTKILPLGLVNDLYSKFARKIAPDKDTVTEEEVEAQVERHPLSDFLMWNAYGPLGPDVAAGPSGEIPVFLNHDGTVGMMWVCHPLVVAGGTTMAALEGMLKADIPPNAVMQFSLYSDSHIRPYLDLHMKAKTRQDPVVQEAAKRYCDYLEKHKEGPSQTDGTPLRIFRLFVTLKFPMEEIAEGRVNLLALSTTIKESLVSAGLGPQEMNPQTLLMWARRFFNGKSTSLDNAYDPETPISRQAINADTEIVRTPRGMTIGGRHVRVLTPKIFPKDVRLDQTGDLFGAMGVFAAPSNRQQIKAHFLYTVNVLFKDVKAELKDKKFWVERQQWAKGMGELQARWAELDKVERDLTEGGAYLTIIPSLVYWHEDEKEVEIVGQTVTRMWEGYGYGLQEEKSLSVVMLLSALPFGLLDRGRNLNLLERHFIANVDAVVSVLPVQGDFGGFTGYGMLFIGRKGQIVGLDFLDEGDTNNNIVVTATTGAGKSFALQKFALDVYGSGAKVRGMEIGGSFRKLTKVLKGRYLEFDPSTRLCLNPFSSILPEAAGTDDPNAPTIKTETPLIASLIMSMVYSSSNQHVVLETEMTLLKDAVRWAYEQEGPEASMETVHTYLAEYPHMAGLETSSVSKERLDMARDLGFNLKDWLPDGSYGQFMNGKSNLNLRDDEFVFLELERIKSYPELFRVLPFQVLNEMTRELYTGDRVQRTQIIFDEVWQFVDASSAVLKMIVEGYRRCRKYNASFAVITQSINNFTDWGEDGLNIFNNAGIKLLLRAADYPVAQASNLIDYDPVTMRFLTTTATKKPHYSEIFVHSDAGVGVARLVVDPYTYFACTSKGPESAEIMRMVDSGMSEHEAILQMIEKHRPDGRVEMEVEAPIVPDALASALARMNDADFVSYAREWPEMAVRFSPDRVPGPLLLDYAQKDPEQAMRYAGHRLQPAE